ncbi:hypothetical protein COLO4_15188 [Corchorus olitorius]|uniref:Uncharacterized protein n=1 Tax=Corchorus olitorius TaxID=93759 RepID=A0A1R3JP86_9ROSI|nr:hypothetical protein COLO4_15188 [Corchorus olitorius]
MDGRIKLKEVKLCVEDYHFGTLVFTVRWSRGQDSSVCLDVIVKGRWRLARLA